MSFLNYKVSDALKDIKLSYVQITKSARLLFIFYSELSNVCFAVPSCYQM